MIPQQHSASAAVRAGSGDGAASAAFSLQDLPASFYDDPYPTYRALQENDPVHRMPDGTLFLTRYRDLEAIYKDTVRFSSDKKVEFAPKYGVGSRLFEHHTTSLVFNDPPLHTRVRHLIAGALSPRAIAEMEPGLTELVDRLLDRIQSRGEVDLIEDFAAAIPVEVIGNLLNIPHEERGPLRGWSLAILGALEPVLSDEVQQGGERAVADFLDYLRRLVADRRRRPGDPEHDVLTRLIAGESDGGHRLSEVELLQNCIFILNAGHETTTNLIGNGLELLLRYPGERQRLIDDPALIRTAIEEFLRFESSNQLGNRRVVEAAEIGGTAVAEGTLVTLCIGAANRDPEQFAAADRLDVGRTPNRHLAFASGPHVCAGLNLARLEGRVAIGRFLARFPAFTAAAPGRRARRARFRGFVALPARLA
ncbi:cytochrome P450 [Chelatococcus reniformis]|uniref:Cytochrome P450 n=1 Tax=Chelatococcus reniformis TaxID=1494448 RepID=A0A916U1G4_9HYPH|nr:cytochrome P450 [Chelatococcus reniformis]GGC54846.1 cytochrome P450 [Chelatococcus reniformis]